MNKTKSYMVIKALQPPDALKASFPPDAREIVSDVLLEETGLVIERVDLTEAEAAERRTRPHIERVLEEGYGEVPPEPDVSAEASRVTGEDARKLHRIPEVWARGYKGSGQVMAILDTGISRKLADKLKSEGRLMAVESMVPGEDGYDGADGHGPWCVSCIEEIAPDAKIISIKVLSAETGSGSSSGIIKGDQRARELGATVVSKSLGGPGDPNDAMSRSTTVLRQNGVLAPCAAGNEQRGSGAFTADGHHPGNSPGAECVAAVDSGFGIGEFSSWGKSVDSAAIGVLVEAGGRYMSGTSMATPHVAGILALGRDACGGRPEAADLVESAYRASCRDTGLEAYKEGHGVADAVAMIDKLVGAAPVPPETKPPVEPAPSPPDTATVWLSDLEKQRKPEWFENPIVVESRRRGEKVVRRFRTVPMEPRQA